MWMKKEITRIGILLFTFTFCITAFASAADWKPSVTSSVESFQGGGFTGAGSYSIPISVPKAIGGMMPQIALTYDTQQLDEGTSEVVNFSDGRLGKGWRISGVPSIQRESMTSSVYYLNFGGARSKLISIGNNAYRTEKESFVKIQYNSTSDYWEMWTKDGTYYKFGGIDYQASQYTRTSCSTVQKTYEWDVAEIQNTLGDKIMFYYVQNVTYSPNPSYVIAHGLNAIVYNFRNNTYPENRAFRINFGVEPVSYTGYAYFVNNSGCISLNSTGIYMRYTDITVSVYDHPAGGAWTEIQQLGKYVFTYNPSTVPADANSGNPDMKLTSVKTIIGTDTSIPAIEFAYDAGGRLTQVYNPATGGTGQLAYESFPVSGDSKTRYRVTSSTSLDGMGNSYTTRYAYGTPSYDATSKEFRGHSWVRAIDAADHYSETLYYQDAVKKGIAYETSTKDKDGNIYAQTKHTYTTSNPYTGVNLVLLSQTDNYLCDKETSLTNCKQTQIKYTYDGYGNTTLMSSMGNANENGDELYFYTEYKNIVSSWRLGIPKHSYTLKSDNTTKVAETWSYYSDTFDGTPSYDDTTTKFLRKVETGYTFTRGDGSNPFAITTYDQYGNVTSVSDALGNTITTAYDSVFHQFPISVTNALGTAYTYYYGINADGDSSFTGSGLWGQVKSVKDINGNFMRTTYDTLGRPLASWDDKIFTEASPRVTYAYSFYTNATNPSKMVATTKDKPQGFGMCTNGCKFYPINYFSTYMYTDGLGRTIQTLSPSEEAGKMMVSGPIEYNSLGQVATTYIGYKTATTTGAYISLPTKTNGTTFTYDPVGRVIKTTFPDGNVTQTVFKQYVTTSVDANNRQIRSTRDSRGRLIKTQTFTGTYPTENVYSTTQYEYDPLGRQTKVIDNAGNSNSITYDTLGRKTAMLDMDMGYWRYSYDILGRLTSQIDNKGQETKLSYDALSRITKKEYPDLSWIKYYYDTYSGYTGTNSLGRLIKTEKGRN